jgi:hypothetical protein
MTQDVYMGRKAVDPRAVRLSRKHLVTGKLAYRTSRRRQKMGIQWVWQPSVKEDRHFAGLSPALMVRRQGLESRTR